MTDARRHHCALTTKPYNDAGMGARTFRSRWVVRWAVLFGSICVVVSALIFAGAYRSSQSTNTKADQEAQTNARICEEQSASGGGGDDSQNPCARIAGPGVHEDAKGYLASGVLLVLGLAQLIGAYRIGVTFTGPGIIVRNPLRTHRIRWAEIADFTTEYGTAGRLSYAFGRVDLTNGDSHRIEAICAMPWESKHNFKDKRVIDALNEELVARRDETVAHGTERYFGDLDLAHDDAENLDSAAATHGPASTIETVEVIEATSTIETIEAIETTAGTDTNESVALLDEVASRPAE